MKLFQETQDHNLKEIDFTSEHFQYEVEPASGLFNMHQYLLQNRNIIFGQYLYLLHEVQLSNESTIDFIGFTESGAVLLIEVKRGADTRNRQEVISQLGKYALDAYSVNNLISNEVQFLDQFKEVRLQNKKVEKELINKIRVNLQQSNLNMFLVTEDATDELLASIYHLSYGIKNQKISVIEIKRYSIADITYCSIRQFNKRSLLNSTRKVEYQLDEKLNLISDLNIQNEIKRQINKWYENGYTVAPLTVSTPEYFTFEWKKGQSIWVSFYLMDKKTTVLSGLVKKNSFAIQVDIDLLDEYQEIIKWLKTQRNYYYLETNNKGKSRDYYLYCIDISEYESDEIDALFDKLSEIALMKKDKYFKK